LPEIPERLFLFLKLTAKPACITMIYTGVLLSFGFGFCPYGDYHLPAVPGDQP
jgi:hypothetical protein